MKEHRLTLLLPESFDALAVLPLCLRRYADEARYFLNLVVRKTVFEKTDRHGFVRLHGDVLREIIDNRRLPRITEALLSAGIVDRAPYHVGKKSFGHRLVSRFLSERCVHWTPTYRPLCRKLAKFFERHDLELESNLLPIHKELRKAQERLTIDTAIADPAWEALEPHTKLAQSVFVMNIKSRCPSFSVGQYGRVSNAIANLKKTLRPALRIDGQTLANVDLRCSQPTLLGLLMQQHGITPPGKCTPYIGIGLGDDMSLFKDKTSLDDDLYYLLSHKCRLSRELVTHIPHPFGAGW